MQINSVSISGNNCQSTSFKSVAELRKGVAAYDYYNTTSFFRYKFDIRKLIQYMENFYNNTPVVNIISHACSEGQETFSIKFLLSSMLKERANKYCLEGRDFDALNILYAKKGAYAISKAEMERMEKECGLDLYKYINICGNNENSIFIRVKDHIKEQIPFKKVDILKDDKIPAENTVLLARNMWPYLPAKMQTQLAEKMANTLSPSSHIVLGDFDISNNVHQLLRNVGFEHTEIFEVMKKPGIEKPEVEDARLILNKIKAIGTNKILSI